VIGAVTKKFSVFSAPIVACGAVIEGNTSGERLGGIVSGIREIQQAAVEDKIGDRDGGRAGSLQQQTSTENCRNTYWSILKTEPANVYGRGIRR